MNGLYHYALWFIFIAAFFTFVALLFIKAPYGRHQRAGWGWTVAPRVGWIMMELPSVALFSVCYVRFYSVSRVALSSCLVSVSSSV